MDSKDSNRRVQNRIHRPLSTHFKAQMDSCPSGQRKTPDPEGSCVRVTVKECHSRNQSPQRASRILFHGLPYRETYRGLASYSKSQTIEQDVNKTGEISTRNSQVSQILSCRDECYEGNRTQTQSGQVPRTRSLGDNIRSEGCVLSCTDPPGRYKVSQIHFPRRVLRVPCSPLWSFDLS